MVWTQEWHTLIEKDHLGYWSPEKYCCLWLTLTFDNLCGSHLQVKVVETSVTNNSPPQDSYHPDDLFQSSYGTSGFKPLIFLIYVPLDIRGTLRNHCIWLPHRLSKYCQLQTTVLLRTPITQMIFYNQSEFTVQMVQQNIIELKACTIRGLWQPMCSHTVQLPRTKKLITILHQDLHEMSWE